MELSMTEKAALQKLVVEPVLFNEAMAHHTSIHVGWPAAALVSPQSADELVQVMQWARQVKRPYLLLGKGSNTLIKYGGFPGVVISLTRGFREFKLLREEIGAVWVQAQGGVPTQQWVRWGASQG